MPALDYRELRRRFPMRRVLALLAYRPTARRGDQWRGPCPFCTSFSTSANGESRPQHFAVHLTRNVFHCFRCQARGNALDLWCLHTCLPLHAAALDLCRSVRESPPWLTP